MEHTVQWRYANRLESLEELAKDLQAFLEERVAAPVLFQVNLCLDELMTNSVSYGYEDDTKGSIGVSIRIVEADARMYLCYEDDGRPFDPLQAAEGKTLKQSPDVLLSKTDRGGLGVPLVIHYMENLSYSRSEGRNILRFEKALSS